MNNLAGGLASYRSMEGVRVLSRRVVAPYDHIIDFIDMNSHLIRNLTYSSALVESCQCTEVLFGYGWCKVRADQGIGVCRVAYNHDLDTFLSH